MGDRAIYGNVPLLSFLIIPLFSLLISGVLVPHGACHQMLGGGENKDNKGRLTPA